MDNGQANGAYLNSSAPRGDTSGGGRSSRREAQFNSSGKEQTADQFYTQLSSYLGGEEHTQWAIESQERDRIKMQEEHNFRMKRDGPQAALDAKTYAGRIEHLKTVRGYVNPNYDSSGNAVRGPVQWEGHPPSTRSAARIAQADRWTRPPQGPSDGSPVFPASRRPAAFNQQSGLAPGGSRSGARPIPNVPGPGKYTKPSQGRDPGSRRR